MVYVVKPTPPPGYRIVFIHIVLEFKLHISSHLVYLFSSPPNLILECVLLSSPLLLLTQVQHFQKMLLEAALLFKTTVTAPEGLMVVNSCVFLMVENKSRSYHTRVYVIGIS